MNYSGLCKCKTWGIRISVAEHLRNLSPRVCDCEYCKAHPSAVISHPDMKFDLVGDKNLLTVSQNGDKLATFYHCTACGDLLAVGREINGRSRGAVNALLLDQRAELGEHMAVQPRLLAATDKLRRWEEVWGEMTIRGSEPT